MKVMNTFRVIAIALCLPAVGIAVAAGMNFSEEDSSAVETLPAAIESNEVSAKTAAVDGRQDDMERGNWVWLDSSKRISGRVSGLSYGSVAVPKEGMNVHLLSEGKVVASALTHADGSFEFEGVEPGVYSLVGRSADSMVSFGFYALPAAGDIADSEQIAFRGNSEPMLDVLATSADSFDAMSDILAKNVLGIDLPEGSSQQDLFEKVSRQSFYLPTVANRVNVFELASRIDAGTNASTSIAYHPVVATKGELKGQASQIFGTPVKFELVQAYLLQRDQVVAQTALSEDGSFTLTGISPGEYSFVAVGAGNVAMMGVSVTDIPTSQSAGIFADGTQFVSTNPAPVKRAAANLAFALIQDDFVPPPVVDTIIDDDDGFFVPAGDFGPPVGTFGGGGGGLIGGGRILPFAALGVGIAALADDDDQEGFFNQGSPNGE